MNGCKNQAQHRSGKEVHDERDAGCNGFVVLAETFNYLSREAGGRVLNAELRADFGQKWRVDQAS